MKRLVGVALLCACASEPRPAMHTPPSTPRPVTSVAEPRDVATLARWVDELPAAKADARTRVASTIDLLADYFVRSDPRTHQRLEATADRLRAGNGFEVETVRAALAMTLDSLATGLELPPDSARRSGYMMARRMRLQISRHRPLDQQLVPIAQSLRAVTNLLAIREDEEPPFPMTSQAVEVGFDPAQFAAHVRDASDAVHELAAIRDWKRGAQAAGDALDVLADAIATAPLDVEREYWRSLVREMRYRAGQLVLSPQGIDRAQDVSAGLRACADAIQRLKGPDDAPPLANLASDAVSQIDAGHLFALQRAAIQEAFRTAADATYVAATARNEASAEARRTPRSASTRR